MNPSKWPHNELIAPIILPVYQYDIMYVNVFESACI